MALRQRRGELGLHEGKEGSIESLSSFAVIAAESISSNIARQAMEEARNRDVVTGEAAANINAKVKGRKRKR